MGLSRKRKGSPRKSGGGGIEGIATELATRKFSCHPGGEVFATPEVALKTIKSLRTKEEYGNSETSLCRSCGWHFIQAAL